SYGERIDRSFQPVADFWEALVLYPVPIAGIEIPIVLILLISGAFFFTIYFGFPGIAKFPLAINTVRGKYDKIEHAGMDDTEQEDIPNTIRDESKKGEVSHFQALATALSG